MTAQLASIVARANIGRLSLVGLSKNVGKTTTTNHLLETLLGEGLYRAQELALTSLGLDGEATDALTGLPKPRYVPQAGLLVATTADLMRQAEHEGAQIERLQQLPGRTALGPVILARVLQPGRIVIAGPTLLSNLRSSLDLLQALGVRLSIIDGAINRLGAAAPGVTDACILCTGASAAATPELVVEDGTRIFCHSIVLQRLSARGLDIRVARPIRVLALTMNPYTPEYVCTPQHLLDTLVRELPPQHPPIIDVVSGYYAGENRVTS